MGVFYVWYLASVLRQGIHVVFQKTRNHVIDKLIERVGSFAQTHNSTQFDGDGHWRCETGDAPFCEYNVII